jgi:hypothetical protein
MSGRNSGELILVARANVRCGLPPPPDGPAEGQDAWYERVEKLPTTRVTGWFGATIGSSERDDDVLLFFYDGDPGDGDHLDPVLKLATSGEDLVAIHAALGDFIKARKLNAAS